MVKTSRSIARRIALSFALVAVLLIQLACQSFATTLRVVVAAGAPILNILVQQGKISPTLKDGLILDLTNEGYRVGDMATCFNAIPKGDSQSKLKHLQCVQTLDQAPETRKLLADFGASPFVKNIAEDIDAIIQAGIILYGGTPRASMMGTGVALPQDVTEKAIKRRIEQLKKDLGQ